MIILASNSPTRAQMLQELGVSFSIKVCDYDEECVPKLPAETFSGRVVEEKARQFAAQFGASGLPVLFADSCVVVGGRVLGKASSAAHARELVELQSGNEAAVFTAMKLVSPDFTLDSMSVARFVFAEFSEQDIDEYIASMQWQGKAGAMSIEGMFGKYVVARQGDINVAMGLDTFVLKTFL